MFETFKTDKWWFWFLECNFVPAGWGSERVVQACGNSQPFNLGHCQIGGAFWMAVAGTVSIICLLYTSDAADE